jgi:hypothetical protein
VANQFRSIRPGAEAREPLQGHRNGYLYGGQRRHQAGGVLYWPPTKVDYKNVFTDDAREFWFKLDGKNIYPNPQGPNGLGQTVAMWLVDRNTIYRERATKGLSTNA